MTEVKAYGQRTSSRGNGASGLGVIAIVSQAVEALAHDLATTHQSQIRNYSNQPLSSNRGMSSLDSMALSSSRTIPTSCSSGRFSAVVTDLSIVQQTISVLKKGYFVMKHSPKTSQPHQKLLYISEDRRRLCWKSLNKNDEKSLSLKSITRIESEEAYLHLRSTTFTTAERALVIVGESRSLEIEVPKIYSISLLRWQLEIAMANSRRISMNYEL